MCPANYYENIDENLKFGFSSLSMNYLMSYDCAIEKELIFFLNQLYCTFKINDCSCVNYYVIFFTDI